MFTEVGRAALSQRRLVSHIAFLQVTVEASPLLDAFSRDDSTLTPHCYRDIYVFQTNLSCVLPSLACCLSL